MSRIRCFVLSSLKIRIVHEVFLKFHERSGCKYVYYLLFIGGYLWEITSSAAKAKAKAKFVGVRSFSDGQSHSLEKKNILPFRIVERKLKWCNG